MPNITRLKREIKELEHKIESGVYKGENLLIARDMLNDKKSELEKYNERKVVSVVDAPIKGLKKPRTNVTSVTMGGGMKM